MIGRICVGPVGWCRLQNGRKFFLLTGLLRNSTIFALQKLGLEQCSQKAPGEKKKLKLRPDGSATGPTPPDL